MRKLNLAFAGVLAVLLLAACGGTRDAGPELSGETGYLRFDFERAPALRASQVSVEPDGIRLVVMKDSIRIIRDVVLDGDVVEMIEVPARENYEVIAFSYISAGDESFRRVVLKDGGVTGVTVRTGETTSVEIDLTPIEFTVTTPEVVELGEVYTVGAQASGYINWGGSLLFTSRTPFTQTFPDDAEVLGYSGNPGSFEVPFADLDEPAELYHMVRFDIDERFLRQGEYGQGIAATYPIPEASEAPWVVQVIDPEETGNVDVVIRY